MLLGQLEAGVDDRFLGDGVSQLDCSPGVVLRGGGDILGCEVDSVDSVPSGASAEEDHDLSGSGSEVVEEVLALDDTETAYIDQAVAGVALVEEESAGDGGDSDTVSVIPDSGDDTAHQVAGVFDSGGHLAFAVGISEAKGICEPYGLGTHADDIPDDSADTSGGTSVGLDGRGVVVTLDPESVAVIVIEDHDSCVSAGEDVVAVDSEDELLENGFGTLVAAVLGPCLSERLEFHVGGIPALFDEVFLDGLHLVEGESETEVRGDILEVCVGGIPYLDVEQVVRGIPLDHVFLSCHRIISR